MTRCALWRWQVTLASAVPSVLTTLPWLSTTHAGVEGTARGLDFLLNQVRELSNSRSNPLMIGSRAALRRSVATIASQRDALSAIAVKVPELEARIAQLLVWL